MDDSLGKTQESAGDNMVMIIPQRVKAKKFHLWKSHEVQRWNDIARRLKELRTVSHSGLSPPMPVSMSEVPAAC